MLSLENANFETQILYQGLSTNDRSTFFYKHSPLTVKTDRQTDRKIENVSCKSRAFATSTKTKGWAIGFASRVPFTNIYALVMFWGFAMLVACRDREPSVEVI